MRKQCRTRSTVKNPEPSVSPMGFHLTQPHRSSHASSATPAQKRTSIGDAMAQKISGSQSCSSVSFIAFPFRKKGRPRAPEFEGSDAGRPKARPWEEKRQARYSCDRSGPKVRAQIASPDRALRRAFEADRKLRPDAPPVLGLIDGGLRNPSRCGKFGLGAKLPNRVFDHLPNFHGSDHYRLTYRKSIGKL